MGIAGRDVQHRRDFPVHRIDDHVVAEDVAELDLALPLDDQEFLGLGMMPMVSTGDAGKGFGDEDLSEIGGLDRKSVV